MIKSMLSLVIGVFWGLLSSPCQADEAFFEKRVRPLLIERCYGCHGGEKARGGLSLETRAGWQKGGEHGPAIVPGQPERSLLIDAINYRSLEMPPADEGGKLSEEEIEILTKWVAMGASDPRDSLASLGGMNMQVADKWWSFQPLANTEAEVTSASIDMFLANALEESALEVSPTVSKRTLIRRATYDLTGLPPTMADVEAFLADESPAAVDKVLDRLLESPQYGVRWGRHWLDVVRYGDTAGENTDRPLPHVWRYRNWVFESFNRDLSFRDFARLQICGDIVDLKKELQTSAEGIVATGYLAVARRFGHDIDKDIHLMYEDVIDNLGKTFLGLTLACARCHDHKYDPVTSEDYYALYGIFSSTLFSFPGCEPRGQPADLVPLISTSEADALMADYENRLQAYEQQLHAPSVEQKRLQAVASKVFHVLAQGDVLEGKSVGLNEADEGRLDSIPVKAGEVLQLAVLPQASHGADTTRIEWEISELGVEGREWNIKEIIPRLTSQGPYVQHNGATWCFLDVTEGPLFLSEKKEEISGHTSLKGWQLGETPSVFVNTAKTPLSVWTTLPAESVFVHPGVGRTVAVAWVCPSDGIYQVRGRVTDAHPAGGDGVAFRFEHFASEDLGSSYVALGSMGGKDEKPKPEKPEIPVGYAVQESEVKNAYVQQRGDPEQLGEEVPRRWLTVFGGQPVPADGGSGRRQLAEWIVDQPLFARVVVNRLWQWHFGRGLVSTPNDFGSRGQPPTHPELLDRLAKQFGLVRIADAPASGREQDNVEADLTREVVRGQIRFRRVVDLHAKLPSTAEFRFAGERFEIHLDKDKTDELLADLPSCGAAGEITEGVAARRGIGTSGDPNSARLAAGLKAALDPKGVLR